jgi:outer membrane protein OmpA-like peptidoglycan-associated protein
MKLGNARSTLTRTSAALLVMAVFCADGCLAVAGEQPTETQILDALTAQKSRALPMAPADEGRAVERERIIDNAIRQAGRGLGRLERDQLMAVAEERAKIDLEVNFDYDSVAITPAGMQALTSLGKALSNNKLSGSIFMIAGHTDAKGSAQYNLGLSERRADAVKRFLMDQFKLPSESTFTVGYGMEQLKDKEHPLAAENRRVQVVNMASKPTAGNK